VLHPVEDTTRTTQSGEAEAAADRAIPRARYGQAQRSVLVCDAAAAVYVVVDATGAASEQLRATRVQRDASWGPQAVESARASWQLAGLPPTPGARDAAATAEELEAAEASGEPAIWEDATVANTVAAKAGETYGVCFDTAARRCISDASASAPGKGQITLVADIAPANANPEHPHAHPTSRAMRHSLGHCLFDCVDTFPFSPDSFADRVNADELRACIQGRSPKARQLADELGQRLQARIKAGHRSVTHAMAGARTQSAATRAGQIRWGSRRPESSNIKRSVRRAVAVARGGARVR
jgi:hypothetical protein